MPGSRRISHKQPLYQPQLNRNRRQWSQYRTWPHRRHNRYNQYNRHNRLCPHSLTGAHLHRVIIRNSADRPTRSITTGDCITLIGAASRPYNARLN